MTAKSKVNGHDVKHQNGKWLYVEDSGDIIITEKAPKSEHKTKKIKINNKFVEVDLKIAPLIEMLNKFGIKTQYSCQGEEGWQDGYIIIDPSNFEFKYDKDCIKGSLVFKPIKEQK